MTVGTRVQHLRYPWMVGYITGFTAGRTVLVRWNCALDAGRRESMECEDELRVTPVQP